MSGQPAIVVGIDPGLSGAISCPQRGILVDMPTIQLKATKREVDFAGLAAILHQIQGVNGQILPVHVFVENVHAMPKNGSIGGFKLGTAFGAILGACASLGIAYTRVEPRAWKKSLGLSSDKEASRRRALELFPDLAAELARKKDEGRAEARLIAHFGLRVLGT